MEKTYTGKVTEEQLAKRAKAERVTLEQVLGTITSEYYFSALDGAVGEASRNGRASDEELGRIPESLGLLTICVLELKNGFYVIGYSAPAHPDNFDESIGRNLAKEKAISQIWTLLGFELKTKVWNQKGNSTSDAATSITEAGAREGLASSGSKPTKSTTDYSEPVRKLETKRPGGGLPYKNPLGAED